MKTDSSLAFPGTVAIVVYDQISPFGLGIATEIFGRPIPDQGYPGYDLITVSAEEATVEALGGLHIATSARLPDLQQARIILIPSWRDNAERPPETLLLALNQAHQRGAILISICDGAFVLAHAGLLDGKRATTHWEDLDDFSRQFPAIIAENDVLYVDEGNLITSAGGAAGIDACLHFVRREFSTSIANAIARRMVIGPHRDGRQKQRSTQPVALRKGRTLATTLEWARAHLNQGITTADLAREAAMSERTLLRQFRKEIGLSPSAWLATERIRWTQEALERSDASLTEISEAAGFASVETFRSAFRREVGIAPSAYRSMNRPKGFDSPYNNEPDLL
ncbi:MAG: helix-turn-helix domain-containing protein [Saccharospirillum sp.]